MPGLRVRLFHAIHSCLYFNFLLFYFNFLLTGFGQLIMIQGVVAAVVPLFKDLFEESQTMSGIERIQRASRRLQVFCSFILVFIPVAIALAWIFIDSMSIKQLNLPVKPNPDHPWFIFLGGFLISMIPGGVVMYAVLKLRELFGYYAGGIIFSAKNVRCYRRLGWAVIAWVIAEFIAEPMHSILLTLYNGPGQRLLTLSMSSDMIMGLFAGAAVLTIAWVMDEGRKIDEDQALFI